MPLRSAENQFDRVGVDPDNFLNLSSDGTCAKFGFSVCTSECAGCEPRSGDVYDYTS